MKQKLAPAFTVAILVLGPNAAHAKRISYVNLGGVNLTAWCKKTFGSSFKAKLIGTNAGGWACEQSAGTRRPISVKDACTLQYGKAAIKAGWADAAVETRTGSARFPSMFNWISMDARGWTLAYMIDDDQFDVLVRAAEREMCGFVGPDGRVPSPHLLASQASQWADIWRTPQFKLPNRRIIQK